MASEAPMPLERHPFYADARYDWLVDWLEQRGPYAGMHAVRVPVLRPIRFTYDPNMEPTATSTNTLVLDRRRCAAPAPWTERPFLYVWPVGTDQYGRHVAGHASIVWLPGFWVFDELLHREVWHR